MKQHWTHSYRMRPSFRNVGLACTIGFLAMGIFSAAVAYFNVDGSFASPKRAAIGLGLFWSAWCLLGCWLLLAYYRYRLVANENEILQVGVIRTQRVPTSQVQELKWRCFPAGGSAKLSGPHGTVKIEFSRIGKSERDEVVTFLRATIDPSRQVGWDQFEQQLVRPTDTKKRPLRRTKIWPAMFFFANGVAFFAAWCLGLGVINLIASPVNILFGMSLLIKAGRERDSKARNGDERSDEM